METETLRITEAGDWELWLLIGQLPDGFKWTLPLKAKLWISGDQRFYCIPDSDFYTQAQRDAIEPILGAWDCQRDNELEWWIKLEKFTDLVTKAPGITREYYVVWPGVEYAPGEDEKEYYDERLTPETIKFLKHVHNMTGEPSYETLKVIWLMFQKWGVNWLGTDHRPLDLGFVKLTPIPYRLNWKEILAIAYKKVLFAFERSPQERDKVLSQTDFYKTLATMDLLAVHPKQNVVLWSIDCTPSYELERKMTVREMHQRKMLGKPAYARRVLKIIDRSFTQIMDIFDVYVKRISFPTGAHKESTWYKEPTIAPNMKNRRVLPKPVLAGDYIDTTVEKPFDQWNEDTLVPVPTKDKDPLPQSLFKRLGRIKALPNHNETTIIDIQDS